MTENGTRALSKVEGVLLRKMRSILDPGFTIDIIKMAFLSIPRMMDKEAMYTRAIGSWVRKKEWVNKLTR